MYLGYRKISCREELIRDINRAGALQNQRVMIRIN
jgi:hypothetical protein